MRWFVYAAVILACLGAGADSASVHLTDGSTIQGEVVSLKGGAYTIRSPALGEVRIAQDKIRIVEYGAAASASSSTSESPTGGESPTSSEIVGSLASIQSQIMGNTDVMAAIMNLRNDPVVQAAIADPDVQQMIASGNYSGLMAHPKIIALMNHDGIQAITRQISP